VCLSQHVRDRPLDNLKTASHSADVKHAPALSTF
jgi:hypothetical protein